MSSTTATNSPTTVREPMLPSTYRVLRREQETADTVTLTLERDGEALAAACEPGQFNMLYAFGVGEVPISVSAASDVGEPLVHTIRSVGKTSAALARLKPGQSLGVRGPFGNVWPLDDYEGHDIVVIAGGIGLAPLRPVVRRVLERRASFGHLVVLYGARHPSELLYLEELERWRASPDTTLGITVDRTTGVEWMGPVGIVPRLLARARFDPIETGLFLCGPEVMIEPCVREALTRKLPLEQVHVSLERNMHCAIGLCGHCQFGPHFICRDGPVFAYPDVESLLRVREL